MKKIFKLFTKLGLFLVLFVLSFQLVACNDKTPVETEKTPVETEKTPIATVTPEVTEPVETPTPTPIPTPVVSLEEMLKDVVMEDLTVDYDGQSYSITASNVPEGVEVSYKGNKKSNPGEYTVTATFKYNGETVTKTATLTINFLESVLSAEETQNIVLYGKNILPVVSLNNEKQTLTYIVKKDGEKVGQSALYEYGTYEVEVYAKARFGYAESNHVVITVNIVESLFGLSYDSVTYTWDGEEKSLLVEGELPTGYTVEYSDNTATDAGVYLAIANVKDADGEVVEKLTAVLTIENPENEEFATFLDEFFVEYLEGDQLACNIFCENPENFGLERYAATWYTYSSITDEDITHDIGVFNEMLDELEVYKDARLSTLQQSAYNTIEDFLVSTIKEYEIKDSFFMRNLYVDQFGGYVADFGTYMESYSLRCEDDVKDIVSFIKSSADAFPSYLVYLEEKTEKGYALSDFTVTSMRTYLAEVLGLIDSEGNEIPAETEKEPYYLVNIIGARIDAVDFLTEEQKAAYKAQVATEMEESFMVGVKALYDGLEEFLGKLSKSDEGYLTAYENGQEYYLLQLEGLFGLEDFDVEEYIAELDAYFNQYSNMLMTLQTKIVQENKITSYAQLEEYLEKHCIYDGTPEEMIGYLKEFAKTIVPELESDPDIYIKEMDEASAKVSNAVAYYMKSALDNTAGEYITLNPTKLGGKNDVLSTMAHEGYPGHLYAYVRSKELGLSNLATVMTSTAHGEGWATYVSLQLFKYAQSNSTDQNFKNAMEYYIANEALGHILESRLDVGILYEGWTVKQVAAFLDENGYNGDAAQEIYDLIIETPAVYPAYGYGKMFFVKLHNEAKALLGNYYDEIEFNDMLLSKGWTDLGELKNTYNEYMTVKCHEVGVEFISNI